jgi:hypothetical protein
MVSAGFYLGRFLSGTGGGLLLAFGNLYSGTAFIASCGLIAAFLDCYGKSILDWLCPKPKMDGGPTSTITMDVAPPPQPNPAIAALYADIVPRPERYERTEWGGVRLKTDAGVGV